MSKIISCRVSPTMSYVSPTVVLDDSTATRPRDPGATPIQPAGWRGPAAGVTRAVEIGQPHVGQATAEAAAELLKVCGEQKAGDTLRDYFAVFNEHCLATRGSRAPRRLPEHERLEVAAL